METSIPIYAQSPLNEQVYYNRCPPPDSSPGDQKVCQENPLQPFLKATTLHTNNTKMECPVTSHEPVHSPKTLIYNLTQALPSAHQPLWLDKNIPTHAARFLPWLSHYVLSLDNTNNIFRSLPNANSTLQINRTKLRTVHAQIVPQKLQKWGNIRLMQAKLQIGLTYSVVPVHSSMIGISSYKRKSIPFILYYRATLLEF